MSLIPTVYRSTDAGAPVLTGQVGSLCGLLDAVLVDGYGSGGTARAPAGWTRPFTGSNKRVFRNSAVSGTGAYLRVDDSSTETGTNSRIALLRAYASMSDIDTGTDAVPTPEQMAPGMQWLKSPTDDGTARSWMIVSNERFIYLLVGTAPEPAWVDVPHLPSFAGDLATRKPGDAFHFAMIATNTTFPWSGGMSFYPELFYYTIRWRGNIDSNRGGFVMRNFAGDPGAVRLNAVSEDVVETGYGSVGTFPDPVSGGLLLSRAIISEGGGVIRGFLPNLYVPLQNRPFAESSLHANIDGLPTGTLLLAKTFSSVTESPGSFPSYGGQVLFDLANEW